MLTHFAAVLLLFAADPQKTDDPPFQDLGKQFVESLRSEDVVAYSQCWSSFRRLKVLAQKIEVPPEHEAEVPSHDVMKTYMEARNRHVAYAFEKLVETFRATGDLKRLQLVSIEAHVVERVGFRSASMFHLTVALGETHFRIGIDDGLEADGTWYFQDTALEMTNLSTRERISLRSPDHPAPGMPRPKDRP